MPLDQVDVDSHDKQMSFFDHLEDLRWVIIRSLIGVSVAGSVVFVYSRFIIDKIVFGPTKADFITYRIICNLAQKYNFDQSFCITKIDVTFINTELSGQLSQDFWISFCAGFIVAFPYVLWEIWKFIKPALKEKERKYTSGFIFFSTSFFLYSNPA